MIRQFLYLVLLVFLSVIFKSCKKTKETISTNTEIIPTIKFIGKKIDSISVSTPLTLEYKVNHKLENVYLEVSNSLSSTLISSSKNKDSLEYNIDSYYTSRAGVLRCNLVFRGKILDSKQIMIMPEKETVSLETYLGPSYISTLPNDYAMLVSIPFDRFDNPNMESLQLEVLNNTVLTKYNHKPIDLVNYRIIPSKTKSGKIFLKAKSSSMSSKRLELAIRPSFAEDFMIEFEQNNNIADGKELTSFKTNQIKDQYGNIIANGSLVRFRIQDSAASYFGYAKTINGVAVYKMVHPQKPKSITIQAFVEGFSKSNSINLNYVSYVF